MDRCYICGHDGDIVARDIDGEPTGSNICTDCYADRVGASAVYRD